jgi:hypothetical protein
MVIFKVSTSSAMEEPMDKTISDSILPVVNAILDEVLEGYPEYPYRKAFTNPELRRTLITHVLNQLPNWHPSDHGGEALSVHSETGTPLSQDQKFYLKNLIRQEMGYIIQQSSDCISQTAPEKIDSCFTPSHWFG